MFTTFQVYNWTAWVDVESTRMLYEIKPTGDSGNCSCLMCKNFIAQRNLVYPPEFLKLLIDFGIQHQKETRLSEFGLLEGRHLYSGEFEFIGRIELFKPDASPSGSGKIVSILSRNTPLPAAVCLVGDFDFFLHQPPNPGGDLPLDKRRSYFMFSKLLPWVLKEPYPCNEE